MEPRLAQMENDKNHITDQQFIASIAYLLRETFEGSPEGQPSAYLECGVGIFITLEKLTGDAASHEVHGTTAAAQTEHAKFYLDRLCEFINGRTESVNWDASWLIETVDEAEWEALRSSVRRSYEDTLRCIAAVDEWTEDRVGMAIGMVAHTAYHLGAIRQIAKAATD